MPISHSFVDVSMFSLFLGGMKDGFIRYIFELEEREVSFVVDPVPRKWSENVDYPKWANLEHRQCACCPLKSGDCKYCPVAIHTHDVMQTFAGNRSTERVRVTVLTPERTYFEECDLQVGINSLMGLMMATSGCPVLKPLSSMASFHIPFCSTRETLRRTVGAYLTEQYFVQMRGGEPDWELVNLKKLYEVLEDLNRDFSKRVQHAEESDAVSNAVIMFFATSVVVATSLDQQLKWQEAYLTNRSVDELDKDPKPQEAPRKMAL